MSVYHKFLSGDLLNSTIYAQPRVILASGSLVTGSLASGSAVIVGWRGNTGVSGSLSLYEGVRSRRDVKASDIGTSGVSVYPLDLMDTHSIDKVVFVSGSYPATGSVRMVKVRNVPAPNRLTDVTDVDWYEEHFSPILGLYDWHSRYRDCFFTGSYDYYSLYFEQDLRYQARSVFFSGSTVPTMTSSFTLSAWIKPTRITSSFQDFTIQSQRSRWKFYVTGSDSKLVWTDFATYVSSSSPVEKGLWQHVAVSVVSGSASFFIDSVSAGQMAYTGTLLPIAGQLSATSSFVTLGAEVVMSQTLGPGSGVTSSLPAFDNGFAGFMFESRIWDKARSQAQISSSYDKTLVGTDSGSANFLHYVRLNDGPLGTAHGFTAGSGAFNYGRDGVHGQFQNFLLAHPLPRHPNWQPNDSLDFRPRKTRIDSSAEMFRVVHIPSMFYGRQIATGSVSLVCNAYNKQGIVRVLKDDGRGGLYLSGSTFTFAGDQHSGARWNKVGNVFYGEGLIVITDPSLLDFGVVGNTEGDWTGIGDALQVTFDGVTRTNTKVFMCRLGQGEANASKNPTFAQLGDLGPDGRLGPSDGNPFNDRMIVKQEGSEMTTWITAIGIYNEERQLVAVAKLAQPIRKRERDKLDIRLRMDF